jgi:hypothetical protein
MASLFQVVYTSTAAELFKRAQLLELVKSSVQRNKRTGITGLLLYYDGTFMQTLEGEKAAVMALFSKIERDPRHYQVIPLIYGPIKRRDYASSAMAFRDLNASKLPKVPGYSDFLNTPPNEEWLTPDIAKSQQLMPGFRANTWSRG